MLITLMSGVHTFQGEVFNKMQGVFAGLAQGQNPGVLFVTCADSRLMPELLTQTNPGEFFALRNVGNIIPLSNVPSSEKAGIEYALLGLKNVEHIIICGHSNCGAMKGLFNSNLENELPGVAEWLAHSHSVVEQLSASDCDLDAKIRAATKLNILTQMEHLKSYPAVAKRLANNTLTIHGWLYEFEKGEVLVYDSELKEFMPFDHAFIPALTAYRDQLIKEVVTEYLEPSTHPKTVQEYQKLMELFSSLENDVQPIWSKIHEQVTRRFWEKLKGPHSSKDEKEFTTLLEQGSQFKLPNLKDFQKNVMESEGYQQYMRNRMRDTLFAPKSRFDRIITAPILIHLPPENSVSMGL